MFKNSISRRESGALLNSLTAGVVPRVGLRHIAVGREREVTAILQDFTTVEEGGASFRLVAGPYGSGKSFLLQMARSNAMERGFVTADADLSPERRLTGSKGQGLATYRELMQHLAIMTRPEGGALEAVLQKWISTLQLEAAKEQNLRPGDPGIVEAVSVKIAAVLSRLSEMAYGFAFAGVIEAYWRGMKSGDDALKSAALRWLRGEFATKTEARQYLPVDCVIDDQSWYEFLKLFALFVVEAGYQGLLVFLDEGVNLYKISQTQARDNNYEKVLTIFNDTMQGKARHIGVFLSGTPQFIYDERRGLFHYDALRSRLAQSRFAMEGVADYSGPVLSLNPLTPEELYLLLERLCEVHSAHYSYACGMGAEELAAFLNAVHARLGAETLLTPREITRDFLGILNLLQQNPGLTFEAVMAQHTAGREEPEKKENETLGGGMFADFDI